MTFYAGESGSNEITLNWKNIVVSTSCDFNFNKIIFVPVIVNQVSWNVKDYIKAELDLVRASYATNFIY
ncbi:hypothetical protein LXL04_038159 [Taraxacum kok-saghyz]